MLNLTWFQEHGTGKSRELAGWKACATCTDLSVEINRSFSRISHVFIVEEVRGGGFGKKLVAAVIGHPELQQLRRFMLGTRDAHKLYERFGFASLKFPERFMEFGPVNSYKCC